MSDTGTAPALLDVRVTNTPLPIKGDVNVVNVPTVNLAENARVQVSNIPPLSALRIGQRFNTNVFGGPFTVLELRAGHWVKVRGRHPSSGQTADFLMNLNLIPIIDELT